MLLQVAIVIHQACHRRAVSLQADLAGQLRDARLHAAHGGDGSILPRSVLLRRGQRVVGIALRRVQYRGLLLRERGGAHLAGYLPLQHLQLRVHLLHYLPLRILHLRVHRKRYLVVHGLHHRLSHRVAKAVHIVLRSLGYRVQRVRPLGVVGALPRGEVARYGYRFRRVSTQRGQHGHVRVIRTVVRARRAQPVLRILCVYLVVVALYPCYLVLQPLLLRGAYHSVCRPLVKAVFRGFSVAFRMLRVILRLLGILLGGVKLVLHVLPGAELQRVGYDVHCLRRQAYPLLPSQRVRVDALVQLDARAVRTVGTQHYRPLPRLIRPVAQLHNVVTRLRHGALRVAVRFAEVYVVVPHAYNQPPIVGVRHILVHTLLDVERLATGLVVHGKLLVDGLVPVRVLKVAAVVRPHVLHLRALHRRRAQHNLTAHVLQLLYQ